jgi:Flp pilus assembly protein TadG
MRFLKRKQTSTSRRGTAMVEAAICLPVFVSVMLGLIQLINIVYFRQKISMAGFIGMQAMASPGANDESVRQRVLQVLSDRGIKGCQVAIDPPNKLETADQGKTFTVTLTAPVQGNVPPPTLVPLPTTYTVQFPLYR